MLENKSVVKVEHVSKYFKLPTDSTKSLRATLVNFFRGVKGYQEQHVLKDISFDVQQGDFFGIVGRNGSGKSTLLKIISKIYVPEKGNVIVNGKLVSFIELGVGFNPELTGRENIYMNGSMLGFTREEIDNMYNDIVEFAELGDFMHQKLKNYSSGMQVRLAFSVAVKAKGDVLVLDEVLAVGDEAFQRKCNDYFLERKNNGETTILVTHDMRAVKKYCNKAVLIENGLLKVIGDPDDVANQYSFCNVVQTKDPVSKPTGVKLAVKDFKVKLLSSNQVIPEDEIECEFSYTVLEDVATHVALSLVDIDTNLGIYNDNSIDKSSVGRGTVRLRYKYSLPFVNHIHYRLEATVRDNAKHILAFIKPSEAPIVFVDRKNISNDDESALDSATGLLIRNGTWI